MKAFLDDIRTGNEAKVSSGLKGLQAHGDASVLPALISVLDTAEISEKSREEILDFFRSLKDTTAVPVLIELLRDDHFPDQRQALLSTLWATKLNFTPYISDFVGIAVEGDFMETLECLTILENLEGPFEERHILEAQLFLKEYLESTEPKEEQKAKLISEIALLLRDWDQNIADEGFINYEEFEEDED